MVDDSVSFFYHLDFDFHGGVRLKRYALIELKEKGTYHIWDRLKQMISEHIQESLVYDDDGQFCIDEHLTFLETTNWKPWNPSEEEYFYRKIWGPLPPNGTEKVIPIEQIFISSRSANKKIKDSHMASIRFHVQLYGQLDQPLLVKEKSYSLIGDVERYLVAKEIGLQMVPVTYA